MSKFIFVFILSSLLSLSAKSDVPKFDIIKLKISNQIYFMSYESKGVLKNGDFCYYDYSGEYLSEVNSVVMLTLEYKDHYELHRELHKISLNNIPEYTNGTEEILYV